MCVYLLCRTQLAWSEPIAGACDAWLPQAADAGGSSSSSGEASLGSWLRSVAAAWSGVGRGAAKGPSGRDVPAEATVRVPGCVMQQRD